MPDPLTEARRPKRSLLIVALALMLIALTGSLNSTFRRLDNLVFDLGQSFLREAIPEDIVLVAVDEASLARFGRWPWSREIHARLIDTLCALHPAVIGFDIAFSEAQSLSADQALARAIRRCGKVVLPLVLEGAYGGLPVIESPPIPALRNVVAGIGRVGVRIDEDGMVRSVDLSEGVGLAAWPLFASELLRVSGKAPAIIPYTFADGAKQAPEGGFGLLQEERRRLCFAGPPGTFPRLSYADVIEGRIHHAAIAGKTVIVGATAVGLGDFFPTPVSADALPMAGVEVQANIWWGLRSGTLVREIPTRVAALFSALLALIPLLWLARLMPSTALFASLLWIGAPIALSVSALSVLKLWFPPAGVVLSALFAYPLWSWQRLESARRYLDFELKELGGAVSSTEEQGDESVAAGKMGFEQRIAWVQAARYRVKHLEEQRREVQAFISHDLRVPLANAVQWLENDASASSAHLLPSLRRAQSMAQDFLRLARAEALERRDMKTLDLIAVLHQAADEMYQASKQRGMRIERDLPDDPMWVTGDFESIERCAINLLQNAVTYGLPDSIIVLGAEVIHRHRNERGLVRFWIENEADALRPEELARLFEKFRRGQQAEQTQHRGKGSGLGLYYVRTVAERHGGHIGVDGSTGGKIRFWFELPLTENSDTSGTSE